MFKLLDYMEYANDAAAQAAYVTNATDAIYAQATGNDSDAILGDVGVTEYREAQSFTLIGVQSITKVLATFRANTGSPSGQVTCRIETDNAGKASGTLAHANGTTTFTPTASAENTITFTEFSLPDGYYWIVFNCDNQTSNNAWNIGQYSVASGYSGGVSAYSEDGGTWNIRVIGVDLTFKLYTRSLQSYSEATIKTQGSYSLKGIAAITDSLNKTLTKTLGSPIDLTGINQARFRIYSSRTGSNIKIGLHDSGGTTTEITPNILSANTWQEVKINLQNVANANKDVIDQIIITIVNADAENTFYIDEIISYTLPNIVIS